MAVPKIFGAPNPQDTGGAMSSLIGAQSQAAGMQLSAIQNAVAQAVQGLQFGAQIRQRKDEQLREIEAQNNLERMRQTFQGDQNRLTREQDERQFQANQRLQRRQLGADIAYKGRALNMQRIGLDADIANQERNYGLNVQGLDLQRQEFQSGERVRTQQLEIQAQQLAEARKNQRLKDQSERYKEWAFQLLQQGGLNQMPDGTVEFDPSAADALIQRFRVGPRPGDVLDAANAPGAGFGVAQAFEEINQPMNQRAMKRTDQNIDLMSAAARSGGGPGFQLQGEPVFQVGPQALASLDKVFGLEPTLKSNLASAAERGGVFWDARNRRLIGGAIPEEGRAQIERFIQSNPQLEQAFTGSAAAPFESPQNQLNVGGDLVGALGAQSAGPGAASAPPPPPPPPGPQGQAQGEQPAQAPQLPAVSYWSRVGAQGQPAEAPPGASLPTAQRGAMQRASEPMRQRAAASSRAPATPAAPRQPTKASERVQAAPRDYEKLAKLIGKGTGLAPEEFGSGGGRGREVVRGKLETMARAGSSDLEEAVTLARSLGHISEAEAEQLRRRSADVAGQRSRKRKR